MGLPEQAGRGYETIRVPVESARGYMQGLVNTGCEIEHCYDDGGTRVIVYKLPWKVKADHAAAEARIARENKAANEAFAKRREALGGDWDEEQERELQQLLTLRSAGDALFTIQAVVDDAIAHGESTLSFLSSNWPAVRDALHARGMYETECSEDRLPLAQQTCTIRFAPLKRPGGYPMPNAPGGTAWIVPGGPGSMGSVSVSRYSGDLAPVQAKPEKVKPEPDYWTLRRDFIANGGGIRALDRMLAKVTLAEPDLDKVRAEPDPPSPYTDGLHDPHYMEKLAAGQQPARQLLWTLAGMTSMFTVGVFAVIAVAVAILVLIG